MTENLTKLIVTTIVTVIFFGGCTHQIRDEIKEIKERVKQLEDAQKELNEDSKAAGKELTDLKKKFRHTRMKDFLSDTISQIGFLRKGSLTKIIKDERILDWADHEEILKFYLDRLKNLIERNNKNGVRNATFVIRLLELDPETWKNYSDYICRVYNSEILPYPLKWKETLKYYFDILDKIPGNKMKMKAFMIGTVSSADSVRKMSMKKIVNGKSILSRADHEEILKFYLDRLEGLIADNNTGGMNNAILILKQINIEALKKHDARLDDIYMGLTNDQTWEETSEFFFDSTIDRISDDTLNM
ncbi:hypothetical protein QUF72_08550 [Desulfobacterales bacterium HSG2]|nr:hypothetical protein [Desulfobacterales bacterium HSG2]